MRPAARNVDCVVQSEIMHATSHSPQEGRSWAVSLGIFFFSESSMLPECSQKKQLPTFLIVYDTAMSGRK